MKIPHDFLARMQQMLGDEYPAFAESYTQERTNGLRVNTLKIAISDFAKRTAFGLRPIPWAPEGFYYDYTTFPGQHPYFAAGLYYLQEPSAMAVIHYLDPQPGEWILDLAAAPGGKATHIASRLRQQGLLWANEYHPGRARILKANLERWGAANVIVSNESPDRLAAHLEGMFDRVLVDAPCSGEGMFRKDPAACREWSLKQVQACAVRQAAILTSAAKLLKPGGRLVYSTCTFNREENEEVLTAFLEDHPDFQPLPLPPPDPRFTPSPSIPGAVRLYPHRLEGEGHFIAALAKSGTPAPPGPPAQINRRLKASSPSPTSPRLAPNQIQAEPDLNSAVRAFKEFVKATLIRPQSISLRGHLISLLTGDVSAAHAAYALFGNHLYLNPAPQIPLAGLKILSPGLHLGKRKPGRFQPGPALALCLPSAAAADYLAFDPQSPELRRYLQGDSLPNPGSDGWVLVGVEEFPLGWGKRVQGMIKNHYPKEWRFTPRV